LSTTVSPDAAAGDDERARGVRGTAGEVLVAERAADVDARRVALGVALGVGVGVGVGVADAIVGEGCAGAGALDRATALEVQAASVSATSGSTANRTRGMASPSHAAVARRRSAAPVRVLP
jgi:hypothetical protein